MFSVLIALLLLGILVTVHEFGHFFFARLCGISVREYAIGFGPVLFQRTGKKGTTFSLRLIPVGGYCAFYGEDSLDKADQEDPRAFSRQRVWKRMITVLMGPGMNFLLAFLVLFFYVWIGGTASTVPCVSTVEAQSPAEQAGLMAGDEIIAIEDQSLIDASLSTFTEAITAHQDALLPSPIGLTVMRGGEQLQLSLTPFYDEAYGRFRIGISVGLISRTERRADGSTHIITNPATFVQAGALAWNNCTYAGTAMVSALKALITTGEGLENTSGPVGIVSLVSDQVQTGGFDAFINLLIMISINLGIMNLLPIPGLDGSRLIFLLIEVIRRKPVPPEKEAAVHLAGFVLLIGLMLFFTYNDIMKLIH